MDMQLYVAIKQVCWNQHIIQSFLCCLGVLMKGSASELYVTEAYGGIRGMFGKCCVKAMKVFRAAALFQRFLSYYIEQYLITACIHQTGTH